MPTSEAIGQFGFVLPDIFVAIHRIMKTIQQFFLLLSATTAFSQNYHPFIQHDVYRDEYWAPELQFCTFSYGYRYWFRGDSTVNGQTYQKLLSAPIFGAPDAPPMCPPYTVDTNDYVIFALMREDTAAKRVFQLDFDTGTEFLLFDFSVAVGDSVTVGNPPEMVYVENTWAETWADGADRKKMIVRSPEGFELLWIESLGNENNLWNPLSELCICPHGICYQQNGQDLYGGGPCATIVYAGEFEKPAHTFRLTPNPVSETLSVQMLDEKFDRVLVIGLSGEVLMEEMFSNGLSSTEIAVKNLPAGLYHIVLYYDQKRLGAARFQKI